MAIPNLLALDFDGVLCDGMREYFETTRRTYLKVWPTDTVPGEDLFPAFRTLRPVIMTGWEMPILLRAIVHGYPITAVLQGWEKVRDALVNDGPLQGTALVSALAHWSVHLADIQGKEAGTHKCDNLRGLIADYTKVYGRRPRLWFVEDRLETLQHVTTHADLADVGLFLAAWGYNTEETQAAVQGGGRIRLLALERFRQGLAAWL